MQVKVKNTAAYDRLINDTKKTVQHNILLQRLSQPKTILEVICILNHISLILNSGSHFNNLYVSKT